MFTTNNAVPFTPVELSKLTTGN